MIRNYLKTAIRNLLRYKGFSLINIASLTAGIVGCLVIGLFVWDEKQFDKHIPGAENIYRVYDERLDNNNASIGAVVAPAYATFLQQQYPEVDTTARMMMALDRFLMEAGETKNYEEKGRFVDPSFFNMFSLPFKYGDPNTALTSPLSIVLSEELAQRYYGNQDPVGKTIFIDKDTFEVKGVFAKLPAHFHLDFNYLMPVSAAATPERLERWGWHQFYTYVRLKPGTDPQQVQDKFQDYMKKEILPKETAEGSSFLPFFQPLKDIHLNSSGFVYDNAIRGNAGYVKGLTIIALFVLVIACFNFINLSTARSLRRAKEIGVRKVVGADRKQLVVQFIGETVLLSVISMLLAVVITWLVIPSLNDFTEKSIRFNPVTNPKLGLLIMLSAIVIGMLAGIYPAIVLSGFQPIKVLKNMKLVGSGSGSWLRPALVVVQFALSVLLIVSTIIVYRQTKFMNQKDLGFNKDQVIYFRVREGVNEKLETFKSELRNISNVVSVTSGYGLPGDAFAGETVKIQTPQGEKNIATNNFIADHDYIKTLGLRIIAGRDFSREISSDVREAFIINETAVKEFGYGTPEKAIGQQISWDEWVPLDTLNPVKKGRVIGVVQDFHVKSLHEKLASAVIQVYPQITETVTAKLRAENLQSTIALITNLWNRFSPGYPLDYKFMDESFGKMYKSETKLSDLLWIFSIVAICIGCMGLFGLASFSAEQRSKEIGIRKVLGASVVNIIGLLSKKFLLLVMISAIIAFPVAWWAMNKWLSDFPYRVDISWWVFVVAIVAALLIALITVSFQSVKAALMNPVKSLRAE